MNQCLLFATLLAACCALMMTTTETRWKITVTVGVKGNTPACMSKLDARLAAVEETLAKILSGEKKSMDARLEAVEETLAKILSGEKEPHFTFEEEINQLIVAHEKRCSAIDAKIAELMMAPDATDRSLVVHEPNTGKSLVVYRPQDFTAYEWAGLALLVLVSAYVGRRVESYQ
jgi:hypothetical protein